MLHLNLHNLPEPLSAESVPTGHKVCAVRLVPGAEAAVRAVDAVEPLGLISSAGATCTVSSDGQATIDASLAKAALQAAVAAQEADHGAGSCGATMSATLEFWSCPPDSADTPATRPDFWATQVTVRLTIGTPDDDPEATDEKSLNYV